MSRGHGRIQRSVLASLNRPLPEGRTYPEWVSVDCVENNGPSTLTRAHVESVRRAVKRLATENLVELRYSLGDTNKGNRWVLQCRRPLTDDERAYEDADYAEWKKQRDQKLQELTLQYGIDLRGIFAD